MTPRLPRLLVSAAAGAALLAAAPAHAAPKPLHGPNGVSQNKVLVIGTDGTRWDLVRRAMAQGKAPNLKGLIKRGFGTSTLLPYKPPQAFTMSAVGWTTIATGVGPAKHGVHTITNQDPEQATKNGYKDFLTRLEDARPKLSTFMVGDWGNLGEHFSGGPIFSDRIDTKFDTDAGSSAAEYDRQDARDAKLAAAYLRHGNPDAGFLYFGVVDESAHNFGSATARYRAAIARTDARIGQVLRAIRARPTYAQEHWTVIVTTDHGQRNLNHGAVLSHGLGSKLERTSFVVAAGPGVPHHATASSARVVDINPTVLHQMGVPVKRAWKLDGRSFVTAGLPTDLRATLGGTAVQPTLRVVADQGRGGRALRSLRVALPKGVVVTPGLGALVRARAMGRHRLRLRVHIARDGRTVTTDVVGPGASELSLTFPRRSLTTSAAVRGTIRRRHAVTVGVRSRTTAGKLAAARLRAAR